MIQYSSRANFYPHLWKHHRRSKIKKKLIHIFRGEADWTKRRSLSVVLPEIPPNLTDKHSAARAGTIGLRVSL